MKWKDIDMLPCRKIISVHLWLHEAVTLNDCVALATLFFCASRRQFSAKWTQDISPSSVCHSSACCHSLWCKYPSIYVSFLLSSPICSLILLCCCWQPSKILQLLQALSSSSFFASSFTSYFINGQQNVCHICSHAEALLLLPLPLSLSLSHSSAVWLSYMAVT